MQNPTKKFRQSSIVFEKPGILSEKSKIWGAPSTIGFNNFCWNFVHVPNLPMATKGCVGFFLILFRTSVICQNQKVPGSYILTETNFINNSRSKQNKTNLTHTFVDIHRKKKCAKFSKKY